MEKIKDLSKVILTPDAMLGEMKQPKRYILAPDGTKDEDSYVVVLRIGDNVKDIAVGDIVIKYGGQMNGFTINPNKDDERTFVIMSRGAVLIAVTPSNFINPDVITESVSI